MGDTEDRDVKITKTPDTDQKMWDSAESMRDGAESSGELGSSLGDLFADESIDEISAVVIETIAATEIKADDEEKETGETKLPDEVQASEEAPESSKLVVTDDGKEVEEIKNPDEAEASSVEGLPDNSKVDEEDKSPTKQQSSDATKESEQGKQSDDKETNAELKDSDALEENESKEHRQSVAGDGDDELISVKSFHSYKSYGSEDGATGIDREDFSQECFFLNIDDNRASRFRRPSIHTIRSTQTFASSEDEMYTDLYDAAFIDFEVSRKRKLAKWEDVIEKLESERKNEVRKEAEAECTLDIDSDADAANEDQLDEWLVSVDPEYKLKGPKQSSPDHILTSGKLDAKKSCECLRKVFPQPKGFEYSIKPTHFNTGLPIPNRSEPLRTASLEKLVLQKDYNTVTAKFLLPKGEIYNKAYQRSTEMLDIRMNLARIFKIPVKMIILQKDGITLDDKVPLETLGIEQCGSVEIYLGSNDPVAYPIIYDNILEDIPVAVQVPDVINVTVHLSNGEYQELIVEIFNEAINKPWLGGYRDAKTRVDYHHAFSQTPPLPKKPKFHRDTQTPMPPVTQYQNTPYNKGTQMSREDYFVPSNKDQIVSARPYIPFDQKEGILKKVITIQRYVRAWLVRKMLKKMSKIYKEQASMKADLKRQKDIDLEHLLTGNAICNIYPRSREDFSILYSMVERWRQGEIEKISRLKTEAPKKAEFCLVLEKEIHLLNSIEKHRIAVKMEKLEKKEIDFMDKSAHPKTWVGGKGKVISMATLETQRAGELRDIYRELNGHTGSTEKRLNVLVCVKHALKDLTCENAKAFEIVQLIDREVDMLGHGLMSSQLEYLRKRLAKAFRDLMKVQEFNPEGSKYFSEETAYLRSLENMFRCTRCDRYVQRDNFVKTTRMKSIQHCISCGWLETVGGSRLDLSLYRNIMRSLRRDEKQRCCTASIAFIMQEEDFYFLINNIWHGKSPISELEYLPDLRLCRWDIASDWSPWNCILLSNIEMHAHMHLTSPEQAYSSAFVADVKKKHQIALLRFNTIIDIENLKI